MLFTHNIKLLRIILFFLILLFYYCSTTIFASINLFTNTIYPLHAQKQTSKNSLNSHGNSSLFSQFFIFSAFHALLWFFISLIWIHFILFHFILWIDTLPCGLFLLYLLHDSLWILDHLLNISIFSRSFFFLFLILLFNRVQWQKFSLWI